MPARQGLQQYQRHSTTAKLSEKLRSFSQGTKTTPNRASSQRHSVDTLAEYEALARLIWYQLIPSGWPSMSQGGTTNSVNHPKQLDRQTDSAENIPAIWSNKVTLVNRHGNQSLSDPNSCFCDNEERTH